MLRIAAVLVLLLGALSAITTASAYKVARPTNATTVSVVNYNAAQISIGPGTNDASLAWVQGATSGALTIDMTRRSGGSGYTFDPNSTYTAYRVFRITNNSTTAKTVTVSENAGPITLVSGYVGASATPTAGASFVLSGSGGYVEINLQIAAGVSGGSVTYTVTAN